MSRICITNIAFLYICCTYQSDCTHSRRETIFSAPRIVTFTAHANSLAKRAITLAADLHVTGKLSN